MINYKILCIKIAFSGTAWESCISILHHSSHGLSPVFVQYFCILLCFMMVSYPVATIEIYKNNEGSVLNCCCVCFPFPSRSYISFIIWIPSYFCVSYIIHQKCSTILLKMGWSPRRLNLNTWSFKVWILTSFDASRLRGLLYLYFVFLCCICILYFYMYAGWGWRLPPCLWWPLITTRWHTLPKPK